MQKSTGKSLQASVKKLVEKDRLDVLLAITPKKTSAYDRRLLMMAMSSQLRNANGKNRDEFYSRFYSTIIAEPDENVRADVLGSFLGIAAVRQMLHEEKWVNRLLTLATKDPSSRVRYRAIGWVYSSSPIIMQAAKKGRLPELIDAVVQQTQANRRPTYLNRLLSHSEVQQWLERESRLPDLVSKVDPKNRPALLDAIVGNAILHKALYHKLGDEAVLKLLWSLGDDEGGQLVGRTIAAAFWMTEPPDTSGSEDSGALPKNLVPDTKQRDQENDKKASEASALAAKRRDALSKIFADASQPRKQSLTLGLLEGWRKRSTTDRKQLDRELVQLVWDQINQPGQSWQLQPLVQCYSLPDLFQDQFTPETLDRLFDLAQNAEAASISVFAFAPVRNVALAKQLNQEKRSLEYLERIRTMSPNVWQSSARSLLRTDSVLEGVSGKDSFDRLFALIKKDPPTTWPTALDALLDNRKLLPKLIADNRFDELRGLLPDDANSYMRARSIGKLLSNEAVVEFLVKKNRVDELLIFEDDAFTDNDRSAILVLILGSDAAVRVLMENDQFSKIEKIIAESDQQQASQMVKQLIVRESFLEATVKAGQASSLIRLMSTQTEYNRSELATKLVVALEKHDLHREPRLALDFWDFITHVRGYRQQRLAKTLLQAKWFRPTGR